LSNDFSFYVLALATRIPTNEKNAFQQALE